MASKQLGKLKQWASEAISSKERTQTTEEFKELENDIDLRREGLIRLSIAAQDYHHVLSKKKECEATQESEKLLAIDALGVVMIGHGEEFGEESAYGSSLVRFGRAHCKIATLQEAMALTFNDTFIEALNKYQDEVTDYHAQRRKLESRRLSYDAALTKVDSLRKNKKAKDKDLEEAEDELARAKLRYEETAEDVRTRMYAIQENEINQLRDLTTFLDLELNFYQQSLEVLKEVRESWHDEATISRIQRQRPLGPTHTFSRSVESVGNAASQKSPKVRAQRSRHSSSDDEDEEDKENRKRGSRASSFSFPGRRGSARKRSDSSNTAASAATEKDEKEKDTSSKRKSVAGWSMSWGSKSGSKNKDKFSSLRGRDRDQSDSDDDDDDARSNTSKGRGKNSRTPLMAQTKSVSRAVALYDYAATKEDELSFTAGQEITNVNPIFDEWWVGEAGGKSGVFPSSYVRALRDGEKRPPAPPPRPSTLMPPGSAPAADDTSDAASEVDHPFGDHMLVTQRSPVYGHFPSHEPLSPEHSAAEDTDEGEDRPVLSKKNSSGGTARLAPPMPPRAASFKKTPPPPPPPRRPSSSNVPSLSSTSSLSTGGTPPLPARRGAPPISRSSSANIGLPPAISRAAASAGANKSLTASPFDSTTDLNSH